MAEVDERRNPIPGTERYVECDTLLLSVGLLPENELSRTLGVEMDRVTGGPQVDENRMTSVPGVYACGNVLHVHDIVDFVSKESMIAGKSAAEYNRREEAEKGCEIPVKAAGEVRYTVPQRVSLEETFSIYCRVGRPLGSGKYVLKAGDETIFERKFIKAVPGEMAELPVRAAELEKIKASGCQSLTLETVLD